MDAISQSVDDFFSWLSHPLNNDYDPVVLLALGAGLAFFALYAFDNVNMVKVIKESVSNA